jgi:hypothetical protein
MARLALVFSGLQANTAHIQSFSHFTLKARCLRRAHDGQVALRLKRFGKQYLPIAACLN